MDCNFCWLIQKIGVMFDEIYFQYPIFMSNNHVYAINSFEMNQKSSENEIMEILALCQPFNDTHNHFIILF